mgnify:FL=1
MTNLFIRRTNKNLFFAEHDYQVQDFINRGLHLKGEWIALGPSAMWGLDQRSIKYQIPEDFYNMNKLEDVCLRNHERVEWLCYKLDEYLFKKHPKLREWGIKPFLFNIFPLTILFDGIVSRIFQLTSILKHYTGYSVYVHKAEDFPWGIFEICFSNRETLYGKILSLKGWNLNINLLHDGTNNNLYKDSRPFTYLKNFVRRSIFSHTLVSYARTKNWKMIFSFYLPNKASIMVNGLGEWQYIIPSLQKEGYKIIFSHNDIIFKNNINANAWKIVYNFDWSKLDDVIMNCFEYEGISFLPLIDDRLSYILSTAHKNSLQIIKKVSEIIKRYSVKILLNSSNDVFTSHTVCQVARKLGIPVIIWQHGFMISNNGRINQLNEFNDMLTSDIVLTFGDNVSDAYHIYSSKFSPQIVSVGSCKLDKIKKESMNLEGRAVSSPKILYAISNYLQNTWYYGFTPPYSDCLLYRDQISIMEFLKTVSEKGMSVTVKLYPIYSHDDPKWIDKYYNNNITIIKYKPSFIDLLKTHDVVVLDIPTTVLLQALAASKPVFINMKHWRYPAEAYEMLKKRAVCSDEVSDLLKHLQNYLNTGTYTADINNNDFLKAYGIHEGDYKSDVRAMRVIKNAINNLNFKGI